MKKGRKHCQSLIRQTTQQEKGESVTSDLAATINKAHNTAEENLTKSAHIVLGVYYP